MPLPFLLDSVERAVETLNWSEWESEFFFLLFFFLFDCCRVYVVDYIYLQAHIINAILVFRKSQLN